jgi:hypothetical protein
MNSLLGAFSEHIASYLVTVEDAEVILKDKPILRILGMIHIIYIIIPALVPYL